MQKEQLKAICESLIFTSPEPITLTRLRQIIEGAEKAEVVEALAELASDLETANRGLILCEIAGGYQFRTKSALSPWVSKVHDLKSKRLTKASMETLAIIAYRQPLTRAEVEAIRGVESGWILRSLLEKEFIRILGRKEEPGNPIIYGTSKKFLTAFGLKNISDLPPLKEVATDPQQEAAEQNVPIRIPDELMEKQGQLMTEAVVIEENGVNGQSPQPVEAMPVEQTERPQENKEIEKSD